MKKGDRIRKTDLWLAVGLLVLAGGAFLLFHVTAHSGSTVQIAVDRKVVGEYPLSKDAEIPVTSDGKMTNVVIISDGCAYMKSAKCPDHLCIKQGKISLSGESIVCLPNKVVVTVVGAKDNGLDAVAN